jgi:hypothetical protein
LLKPLSAAELGAAKHNRRPASSIKYSLNINKTLTLPVHSEEEREGWHFAENRDMQQASVRFAVAAAVAVLLLLGIGIMLQRCILHPLETMDATI